jgi:hypothetical protein
LAAQPCRPTGSEEASSRLGRWIGHTRRSHSGCPHLFISERSFSLLSTLLTHLDGRVFTIVSSEHAQTSLFPGTRIQAKFCDDSDGRLVDYGKDEVAGILKASSREEAWVLNDGDRHRAPEPPATLAKTTTAMLVNSPLSNRNPDRTPEYRQVLQVHYLLETLGVRGYRAV